MQAQADVFQMQVRQQYGSLVAGLVSLNPKKRKPWAHWIVFAGCLFVLVSLGSDRQVRDALFAPKLPARTPSSQQVVAQAPRALTARPAQTAAQQPQVAVLPAAPTQPNAAPVAMGAPMGGLPLFATPGMAPQVDPNADSKLPPAHAHKGPASKRAHGAKAKK